MGRRWLLTALALGGAVGCGASSSAPAGRHVIEMRAMGFEPARLVVAPGDTVVWINRDIVPHTATAAESSLWDSGAVAQGDSSVQVMGAAGDLAYYCRMHPLMRGSVLVEQDRSAEE